MAMRIYTYMRYDGDSDKYILKAAEHYDGSLAFRRVDGRPLLNRGYISVSHSSNYLAVAFSDSAVGIDAEIRKDRNYARIAAKLGFKASSKDEFYREWCKGEAFFKLGAPGKARCYNAFKDAELAVAGECDEEVVFYPLEQIIEP